MDCPIRIWTGSTPSEKVVCEVFPVVYNQNEKIYLGKRPVSDDVMGLIVKFFDLKSLAAFQIANAARPKFLSYVTSLKLPSSFRVINSQCSLLSGMSCPKKLNFGEVLPSHRCRFAGFKQFDCSTTTRFKRVLPNHGCRFVGFKQFDCSTTIRFELVPNHGFRFTGFKQFDYSTRLKFG